MNSHRKLVILALLSLWFTSSSCQQTVAATPNKPATKSNGDKSSSTTANTHGASAEKSTDDAKALLGSMVPFEDKASGVSIQYPKSWTPEQPHDGLHIVRFKRPDGGATVALSSQDAFKSENLSDFVSQTNEKVVKNGAANQMKVTINSNKASGELAGSPAYRTEMTYDMPDPRQKSKVTSLTTIKGGRAYTLNFPSVAALHDTYMPVFNEMAKSLKITAAPTALKEIPRRTAIPAHLSH